MGTLKGEIVFLFPGQGSQFVGMGRELEQRYPVAREIFRQADEMVGFPLSQLCFSGPEGELSDTINTQPAILMVSIAILRVFQEETGLIAPSYVAGHSLGQLTAMVAAGALEFPSALKLARERGRLMKEAGRLSPGGMAAVLGLEEEKLEAICREVSAGFGRVQIANYNSPGQLVISGEKKALERAMELAKAGGARRAISLAVSIAGHSPLMESAAREFAAIVDREGFRPAHIPLVANTSARPIRAPAALKEELVAGLTSPVRWVQSIRHMVELGVGTTIELGPKDVLTGLVRRIDPTVETRAVGDGMELEGFPACRKGKA